MLESEVYETLGKPNKTQGFRYQGRQGHPKPRQAHPQVPQRDLKPRGLVAK